MVKGRLNINYTEMEVPAEPIPWNTRNVIAIISEYKEIVSPVEVVIKAIDEAIAVAQASTDANVVDNVTAVEGLPTSIKTAIAELTTIVAVIQKIEELKAAAISAEATEPPVIKDVDFDFMRYRSISEAVDELNKYRNEENELIIPETAPNAKGNSLLEKMYSINSSIETILLVNKKKITDLGDQLDIISRSSTSTIVKDTKWTKAELATYKTFSLEQISEMRGSGIIGAIDLADTDFKTLANVKENYMNLFVKGGIILMATSPISADGSSGEKLEFDLDEVGAFWAAYVAGLNENISLSRQIVEPINSNTVSTKEYYADKDVTNAEDICLECGLIAVSQRDIITEYFEVLNSNTPKYYLGNNDYLDMSIVRTQNLIMNEVREGLRALQGKKNKPVSYTIASGFIEDLKKIYVPDFVDNIKLTTAKNGSSEVIATLDSDYTDIIGTINVYGYNNIS